MDLGIGARIGGQIFQHLLSNDGLGTGAPSAKVRLALSLELLNTRYEAWIRQQGSQTAVEAKLGVLGVTNLINKGGRTASLHAKAMECRFLVQFAQDVLRESTAADVTPGRGPTLQTLCMSERCPEHKGCLWKWGAPLASRGLELLSAATMLRSWFGIVNAAGAQVPDGQAAEALQLARNLGALLDALGCAIPKVHQFVHMSRQLPTTLNPRFSATFLDESFNQTIAAMAAKASPRFVSISVLRSFRLLRIAQGLPW